MRRLFRPGLSFPLATATVVAVSSAGVTLLLSRRQYSRNHAHCAPNKDGTMSEENIPGIYSQDRLRSMSINITGMRIPYHGKDEAFTEDMLVAKEPFAQFNAWFERAAITAGYAKSAESLQGFNLNLVIIGLKSRMQCVSPPPQSKN